MSELESLHRPAKFVRVDARVALGAVEVLVTQ